MVTIIFTPSLLLFFTGFFTAVFTRGGIVPRMFGKKHIKAKKALNFTERKRLETKLCVALNIICFFFLHDML